MPDQVREHKHTPRWVAWTIPLFVIVYVVFDFYYAHGNGMAEGTEAFAAFMVQHGILLAGSFVLCGVFLKILSRENVKSLGLHSQMVLDEIMLNSLPTHIWFLQDRDHYGGANKAHADFLGLAKEDLIGKNICDFLLEEDKHKCVETNNQVFREKKLVRSEQWRTDSKGNKRLLGVLKVPRFGPDGEVAQVVCIASDITERYELERERDEFFDRLQMLMDSIPDVVQYKDADGRWLLANKACLRELKLDRSDFQGKTDKEIAEINPSITADALEHCIRTDQEAWAAGETTTCTETVPRPDGNGIDYFDVLKKPLYNDDGSRKGLLILCRNINRLMAAKEELRDQRDKLEAILKALPDMIFLHDSEHRIIECFCSDESQLYLPRKDICGKTLLEILPQHLAERLTILMQKAMKDNSLVETQYELEHGEKWRHYSARIVPYGDGGALSVVQDVTEKAETFRQLNVFKQAIEDCPAIFVITDAKSRIEYVNQAFCDTTGYSREEVYGRRPNILQSGYHDSAFYTEMWNKLTSGESWRGEFCNKRKDGSYFWEDAIIVPIRDSMGGVTAYVSIKYEVTEKKNQESLLIEQRKEAEAASKAKSEFLSMMSHELRTPLNGMLGMIQLLREGLNDPEHIEFAEVAERSGFGLVRILTDILDLASLSEQAPRQDVFHLDQIIGDVVSAFTPNAQMKGLTFECHRCYELTTAIQSDPYKIRQILFSLVSNAVKFTDEGAVHLDCKVELVDKQPILQLTVADTGIGMPKDALQSIFEPFRQLDQSLTRKFGGTGIGLALTKKFVDQLKGEITVQTSLGKGSTFSVRIPVLIKAILDEAPQIISRP